MENRRYRLAPDAAYRFLCASHTLLGYVSALERIAKELLYGNTVAAIRHQELRIHASLTAIAAALAARGRVVPLDNEDATSGNNLIPCCCRTMSPEPSVVMRQLALIETLLSELLDLANGFAATPSAEKR